MTFQYKINLLPKVIILSIKMSLTHLYHTTQFEYKVDTNFSVYKFKSIGYKGVFIEWE